MLKVLVWIRREDRESVNDDCGAFPWNRDETDKRIIASVKAGTARIINSETEAGGYPAFKPVYREFREEEWDMITLTKK